MAVKRVTIADLGTVSLYKRRGARSIRLSLAHTGDIRVTLPHWAPYQAAIDLVHAKLDWIRTQRTTPPLLGQHQRIGKAHHLVFERSDTATPTTRIVMNEVRVHVPMQLDLHDPTVQAAATKAAIRALKQEAQSLLPRRLRELAAKHGYTVGAVTIRQLKGRWGSCTHLRDITLNCFLMQLPWHLIDYVLLHELAHTKIMAHGPAFWDEVAQHVPNLTAIRAEMRQHHPTF